MTASAVRRCQSSSRESVWPSVERRPAPAVALAEGQEAWIPEYFVSIEPPGTPPPFTLAGSWNVYGDNRSDYVAISLHDRIPYVTFTESDPSRICVDLFGAVSNSNWITQHLTTNEIRNVSYSR